MLYVAARNISSNRALKTLATNRPTTMFRPNRIMESMNQARNRIQNPA
jgi:hypothetical protein